MTEKMKQEYNAPKVKVVSFVVERGFNESQETTPPPEAGRTFYMESRNQLTQTGGASSWRTADGNWF